MHMVTALSTLSLGLVCLAAVQASAGQLKLINPPGLSTPATYTHIVRDGKTLYIAGQVGADEKGTVVGPGMKEQLAQVFANLKMALASQGAGIQHIAKLNIYVTDMDEFRSPELTKMRTDFFGSHKPASTLVQVVRLATKEYKVEIEAIAVVP